MNNPAIAFDFDGVIHDISDGWHNGEIYGAINQEVIEAIYELNKMKIPVFICSSRSPRQIAEFWNNQDFKIPAKVIDRDVFFYNDLDSVGITQKKLPAQLYIDDRAFKYTGEDKKGILLAAIGKEVKT